MEYSNPELPEGINASTEHPLKEFFWLTSSILAVALAVMLVLVLLSDLIADKIPFDIEQEMTARYMLPAVEAPPLEDYLNRLATELGRDMALPEGMGVRVHYLDSDTVNAFATLGGNIYMFRGLLEKLPNENALAMVLAHEMAHVQHRDPIRGMGRAVVLGLTLSLVSGDAGNAILDRTLSQGATLTLLKYSRDQERAADDAALAALTAHYGHAEGAAALFEVLEKEHPDAPAMEFFASHPHIAGRIANVQRLVSAQAAETLALTPLPADFASWLVVSKEPAKPAPAEAGS